LAFFDGEFLGEVEDVSSFLFGDYKSQKICMHDKIHQATVCSSVTAFKVKVNERFGYRFIMRLD